MSFRHPLARAAKVWTSNDGHGHEHRVLVIVTTMPLDKTQKHHNNSLVERLSSAAKEHIVMTSEADSLVLINRIRDWVPA